MRKFLFFYFTFFLFILLSCSGKNENLEKAEEGRVQFDKIINSFVGKKPNDVYKFLGKPDKYETTSLKSKIYKATFEYYYLYDFLNKQYDCKVAFTTDAKQEKIVDVKISSNKCYQITMY